MVVGIELVQLLPDFQEDDPRLGGIAPARALANHMPPLIGRCADNQDITERLRSHVPGRVVVEALLYRGGVVIHGLFARPKESLFLAAHHDFVGDRKSSLAGVVAVLERRRHKLDLVLVAGHLSQEAPACPDHYDIDRRELLDRRVRQMGHALDRLLVVGLFVKLHKVGQVLDLVAALRQPRGAHHHLLSLRNGIGIEDLDLDLIHAVLPSATTARRISK